MLDFVFIRSARAAFCISPIMLDDKFAMRIFCRNAQIFINFDLYLIRRIAFLPGIADFRPGARVIHPPTFIRFAVQQIGDHCNCQTRNDLFDENNAAPRFCFGFALDIKTQVHFLEIDVKRHGHSQNTRF